MKNDFATKADLKKTADGLHHEISAVRTDLTKVESGLRHEVQTVREDLHQEIEAVAFQVVQVSTDLNDFKQETRERFDGVMTAIDGLAGLIRNGQTEKAAVDHALLRHGSTLDNHETRLGVLEQKGK
jgi:hypothetical protein